MCDSQFPVEDTVAASALPFVTTRRTARYTGSKRCKPKSKPRVERSYPMEVSRKVMGRMMQGDTV